jgi:hypothetical protein
MLHWQAAKLQFYVHAFMMALYFLTVEKVFAASVSKKFKEIELVQMAILPFYFF